MKRKNRFVGPVIFAVVLCVIAAIIVMPKKDTLTLNDGAPLLMTTGKTAQLDYASERGRDYDAEEIAWSSSNKTVAVVDQNGKVTARSPGDAMITISADGSSDGTCDVEVSAEPVKISSGTILLKPSASRIAPFSVEAPVDENVYIYLKSKITASDDFAFFVSSGQTASMKAPIGKYDMYYASGSTWYGPKYRFGGETKLYKADTPLEFTSDSQGIHGHTIRLTGTTNGNLPTSEVNEKNFPQ